MFAVIVGVVLAFIGLVWIALVATANGNDPLGGSGLTFIAYSAPGFAVLILGITLGVWG